MKTIFQKIWQLAEPYLNTRKNNIHTKISTEFAYRLLEKEGGDQDIVIPAIILHDVGWKRVPENLQLKAFGPKATSPELNRLHEVEGAKIAKDILERVNYDEDRIEEIFEIIDGHDSRKEAISLNDKLVKDADKLWRCSEEGFYIDIERFEVNFVEYLNIIRSKLQKWLFTNSAKEIAREEIKNRVKELDDTI
ncbi:MAG: HD domain-containing protein [Deltaproteobacteria bacterium]|nr:HD domain-containing protein [Deltaproteobacteria bacterium]